MIEESYKMAVKCMVKYHKNHIHHAYQFFIIKKEVDYSLDFTTFESASYGKSLSYFHHEKNNIFSALRFIKKIIKDFKSLKNISDTLYFDTNEITNMFCATLLSEIKSKKKVPIVHKMNGYFLKMINGTEINENDFFELLFSVIPNENQVKNAISILNDIREIIKDDEIYVKQDGLNYVNTAIVEKNVKVCLEKNIETYNNIYKPEEVQEVINDNIDLEKLEAIKKFQDKVIGKKLSFEHKNKNTKFGYVEEYVCTDGFDKVYNIYTDASLNTNGRCAGYGIVVTDEDKKEVLERMAGSFNINTMDKGAIQLAEMSAIFEVVKHLHKNKVNKKNCLINIYSDSMDSIGYLRSRLIKRKWKGHYQIIKDMINSINQLKMNINFHFIKGHNGNKFNVLADQIAGWSAKSKVEHKLIKVDPNNKNGKIGFKIVL